MRRVGCVAFAILLTSLARCSSSPAPILPAVGSAEFDAAIIDTVASRKDPVLSRCEYSTVHGSRLWEHINVVANDGTFLTIEYPNRERELSGRRKGLMQQKRVPIEAHTIAPCKESIFDPTAPTANGFSREPGH
jgi:hypothetical protein